MQDQPAFNNNGEDLIDFCPH